MQFKGEEKDISKVPAGTPVELSEELKKHYAIYEEPLRFLSDKERLDGKPNYGGYATLPVPDLVIVDQVPHAPYLPALRTFVEGKVAETVITPISRPKTDDARVTKVLTGTIGKVMRKAYGETAAPRAWGAWSKMSLMTGSDPEFFFENDGQIVPAWEVLPKKDTCTPEFWDGFQAEIRPSANICMQVHAGHIRERMLVALTAARKKFPKITISAKPTITVPSGVLRSLDPAYVLFGCESSLNAYGHEFAPVADPASVEMRTAGGHIHLGGTFTKAGAGDYVKAIDAIAGVMSVGIFDGLDDPRRRETYGKAGEYRLPKHGLEYRVLSNGWLRHPAIAHMMVDIVRMSAHLHHAKATKHWLTGDEEVQECINNSDAKLAREIIKRNFELARVGLKRMWYLAGYTGAASADTQAEAALKVIDEGIAGSLKHPDNIIENWGLQGSSSDAAWGGGRQQWYTVAKTITKGGLI